MIRLVPDWAIHYDDFWQAIKVRNLWFIKLRYAAVIFLIGFFIVGQFLLDFRLKPAQIIAFILISVIILAYNITIHITRKYVGCTPGKFNCLHLSLLQMMLDISALMILVYFTGIIESPLHMFFIFHMIIGSLILPGYVVYSLAASVSICYSILAMFRFYGIINNWIITGLVSESAHYSFTYIIFFLIVFSFMLFLSVYIANKIARQLYQREQQLRATLLKLDEAERAKQKYTIGVVHEIKTPVNAVHSILDLILGGFVGEVSEPLLQKISRAKIRTEEAILLINDVLRISKLKLLNIRASESVNIKQLVQNLIDGYQDQFKNENIEIRFSDNRPAGRMIKADPLLLELALSNLIGNSVKYVNDNGLVAVSLYDEEDSLVIQVSDNGIGIPADETERIFEQFYRASNVDKKMMEGSGMGLAIVKEIIVRHSGEIKVKSPSELAQPGRPGTSFIIRIPYSPAEEQGTEEINLSANSQK